MEDYHAQSRKTLHDILQNVIRFNDNSDHKKDILVPKFHLQNQMTFHEVIYWHIACFHFISTIMNAQFFRYKIFSRHEFWLLKHAKTIKEAAGYPYLHGFAHEKEIDNHNYYANERTPWELASDIMDVMEPFYQRLTEETFVKLLDSVAPKVRLQIDNYRSHLIPGLVAYTEEIYPELVCITETILKLCKGVNPRQKEVYISYDHEHYPNDKMVIRYLCSLLHVWGIPFDLRKYFMRTKYEISSHWQRVMEATSRERKVKLASYGDS